MTKCVVQMFLKLWQSWCHYHFPGRPGSDHPLCEESFLNVQPELMKQLLAISLSVDTGKEIYVSMRMYAYMYVSVNHLTVSIYKSKWIDRYMYDVDPSITWAQTHSLHNMCLWIWFSPTACQRLLSWLLSHQETGD